jgi:peptide/nickel transport system permease protein
VVWYTARRVFLLLPVLFGLSLITFAIARLLPGDPVGLALGPQATSEQIAAFGERFGYHLPIHIQYWSYITGLLSGDWGQSVLTQRPVLADLLVFLPATLELVCAAMTLAILLGVPAGLIAAVHRDGLMDNATRLLAFCAMSTPRFFSGLMMQVWLGVGLGLFPLAGRFPLIAMPPEFVTGFITLDALLAGDLESFGVAIRHLALPTIALALAPFATITRMMRAATLEELERDYVMTERALGLSERRIVFKYVLRNAFSSSLTIIGLYFGWLLGGTILVETVFDWPGIGLYATQSILNQDFMPVVGVTLCIGILFMTANLLVDVAYGLLNPKVRYA